VVGTRCVQVATTNNHIVSAQPSGNRCVGGSRRAGGRCNATHTSERNRLNVCHTTSSANRVNWVKVLHSVRWCQKRSVTQERWGTAVQPLRVALPHAGKKRRLPAAGRQQWECYTVVLRAVCGAAVQATANRVWYGVNPLAGEAVRGRPAAEPRSITGSERGVRQAVCAQ